MGDISRTFGAFVSLRRSTLGWTQIRLAGEVGRSEDWMSLVERDMQQVKDLTLLQRLADALGVELGTLIALPQPASERARSRPRKVASATLASTSAAEEDDVRRRPFLTLAAAALFAPTAGQRAAHAEEKASLADLEDLLLYGAGRIPSPRREPSQATVAASLVTSRQEFKAAQYDLLARALPGRIAAAEMVGSAEERARNVARLYNIAVRLCIKVGTNNLVAITADRALTAARLGGDPLITAEAQRMVSSSWRRQGSLARATDIVVVAAEDLLADASVSETARLATRGDLYATAAYTAAKTGDRSYAHALIREAADSAAVASRSSGLLDGVQGVALHELSVHYELGDAGRAIEMAATIDPAALPTAERQARFFTDVARAFDQWGKPEQCYRALLAAEEAAPQEVRRGAVRDLATGLLRHDRKLPGVRGFAARAGVQII
ncbi:helix-turn-helix domain-containing protein [Kitasatospora purpeofusca]|uniref:helix-turn-helix domain-containing protein n=1 Tax=Kitasatospora purpeofusca TaxID=67352 RepID=UPI002256158A|nr:helix-turn-helix domain-containing protein [Kitasatospora purpeofusca]MCX4758987.1 helix-turn-helix domain-containing protein [Kitasatospora purpeofusca]WSR30594.1 helix-turn-helix domain-containing protein [Kitasatospora purpeofusca]